VLHLWTSIHFKNKYEIVFKFFTYLDIILPILCDACTVKCCSNLLECKL